VFLKSLTISFSGYFYSHHPTPCQKELLMESISLNFPLALSAFNLINGYAYVSFKWVDKLNFEAKVVNMGLAKLHSLRFKLLDHHD
jgi:hypothetical protein